MRNIFKYAGVAALTAMALVSLSARGASAAVPTVTSCSFNPSTLSLSEGQTEPVALSWTDANGPGVAGDGAYFELAFNGTLIGGSAGGIGGSSPSTEPISYEEFLAAVQQAGGSAGTGTLTLFATDGSNKVGNALCALTINLAAPTPSATTTTSVPSTTTTAPVTTTTSPVTTTTLGQLPHTGGNVVAPLMFGLGLMVLGVIARRRTSRA